MKTEILLVEYEVVPRGGVDAYINNGHRWARVVRFGNIWEVRAYRNNGRPPQFNAYATSALATRAARAWVTSGRWRKQ